MTNLYIMCGLPFSGKTTLAKRIALAKNAQMIAFDWIWAEKRGERALDLDKVEEWRFILDEAHKRIRETLLSGKSVVYDDISVRKEHRDALRKIANNCNISYTIVFLNTPIEIIKEREAYNKASKARHEVASVNFENALTQWEDPTGEKGVVEYKPHQDINDLLSKL